MAKDKATKKDKEEEVEEIEETTSEVEKEEEVEEEAEEKVKKDDTLKRPIRYVPLMIENKTVQLPIFFVEAVKDGVALYNETGTRVSPVEVPGSAQAKYIARAAARYNAMRRANAKLSDFPQAR